MSEGLALLVAAYAIGSLPVAWLAGRIAGGIDIREHGSGNVGASNVWQTVSRSLVVPVGLAQIAQGLAPVLIARAFEAGDGVQAACGVLAVAAGMWSPWLRFRGGRGVGATIGVLLALSPAALVTFIVVALAGVALRAVPQGVGLALVSTPVAAVIAGEPWATVVCLALLVVMTAAKRLLANDVPAADLPRPEVYVTRLVFDRDVRDREAWVRRGSWDVGGGR